MTTNDDTRVPGWAVSHKTQRIERTYRFGNVREALAFIGKVGDAAYRENRHPEIAFEWGYVTVSLPPAQEAEGPEASDFIMAAKIYQVAQETAGRASA
jgi:4a-hydroxytetrahydrobiopterin dehydratase